MMIDYWDKTHPRHTITRSTLEKSIELDNVVLSAVTKMELMLGATNKTDMAKITKKLSRFNIVLINNDITLQSFELLQNYRLSHGLSLPDSIIAVTALIANLELFTYNMTWTTKPGIVSFRKGSRDGMPVPVYLPATKEILFSIEDNGFVNFKPYIIRSTVANNWTQTATASSRYREYALKDSLKEKVYAGAPYLRVLSNGNTILSYQSTQFKQGKQDVNNAEMIVTVGDAEGRNFTNATLPFKIPANATALWNSIAVLKDDTMVALTSTDAYNGRTEVWMIKGRLRSVNKF